MYIIFRLNNKLLNMKKYITLLLILTSVHIYAQKDTIGIYYQKGNNLIQIEPIKYIRTNTNTLGSALTMGIASSSVKTIYRGSSSLNKVSKETKFYFYFSSVQKINPAYLMQYWMFVNSTTINDFIIAKFKSIGDKRELQVAKINIYSGTKIGIADESLSDITSNKIKEGVYEVTIKNAEKGEYCFMYNGQIGSGAYMPVFDFSVE